MVTYPEDIVKKYPFLHKIKKTKEKVEKTEELNSIPKEYREIYKIIDKQPIDINDIVKLSNSNLKDVMPKLTMLELEGKIKKISGNRYVRCDNT